MIRHNRKMPAVLGVLALLALTAMVLLAAAAPAATGKPILNWYDGQTKLDPSSFSFGPVLPGQPVTETFTLKNDGTVATAALTMTLTGTGGATGAFTKTRDTCTQPVRISLGKGKTCQVDITFSPQQAGETDTATLTAMSKKPDATVTLSLTGRSPAPTTGAITITKLRSGTTTSVAGAGFSIDGSGAYATAVDGTVCISGLAIGSHTVTETQVPNGYSVASPASQTVDVSSVGNCSTGGGSATVTFNDPVVNGTVNIHKTGSGGTALAGAEFTLYNDNAPVGSVRGAEDTATFKTCTTGATGDCTLSNVPLGEYWAVETTTPAGYDTAPDQHVSIGVGPAPNVGDSQNLTFTDTPIQPTGS